MNQPIFVSKSNIGFRLCSARLEDLVLPETIRIEITLWNGLMPFAKGIRHPPAVRSPKEAPAQTTCELGLIFRETIVVRHAINHGINNYPHIPHAFYFR